MRKSAMRKCFKNNVIFDASTLHQASYYTDLRLLVKSQSNYRSTSFYSEVDVKTSILIHGNWRVISWRGRGSYQFSAYDSREKWEQNAIDNKEWWEKKEYSENLQSTHAHKIKKECRHVYTSRRNKRTRLQIELFANRRDGARTNFWRSLIIIITSWFYKDKGTDTNRWQDILYTVFYWAPLENIIIRGMRRDTFMPRSQHRDL